MFSNNQHKVNSVEDTEMRHQATSIHGIDYIR